MEKRKQIPWNKGVKTGIIPPNAFKKGHKVSIETRKNLSISKKGKKYNPMSKIGKKNISDAHKGIKLSEEHKKNISISNTGKIRTEEMKKRYSKALIGKKHTEEWKKKASKRMLINNAFKGKKHSEKTKNKIRLTLTGRKRPEEVKKKLRLATIRYVNQVCGGCFTPMLGHNEKVILDELEIEYGYKIIRQYKVEGYFLDGYIKELKLAIEVDEKPKNTERDFNRQQQIEKKLNCKFLRIKDYTKRVRSKNKFNGGKRWD